VHVTAVTAAPTVLKQALRTQKPVSAVAIAALPAESTRPRGEFAVVLDGVADPGNLGTIVRTACGLGVTDIALTDTTTDLSSRRVLESSRASVLRANALRFDSPADALNTLRGNGFETVVTSPRGRTLQALTPLSGAPVALVVGNETDGVGDEALRLADHVVRIPMAGAIESLNVGVATGVSISELHRAMVLASLPRRCKEITFTDRLRDDLSLRLSTMDHLTCNEFEALVTATAGREIARDGEESLVNKGLLRDGETTPAGEQQLAALWLEFELARAGYA
jgi:TrmH family RNA methyltransferase